MVKLSNKQHEQQQERRLAKLEKRADKDDKVVVKLGKRITSLENQIDKIKTKLK